MLCPLSSLGTCSSITNSSWSTSSRRRTSKSPEVIRVPGVTLCGHLARGGLGGVGAEETCAGVSPVSPASRGRRSTRASHSTLGPRQQEVEEMQALRVFLLVSLVSVRSVDSGVSPGACGAEDPVGPPSTSVLHVEADPRFLEIGVCVSSPFLSLSTMVNLLNVMMVT